MVEIDIKGKSYKETNKLIREAISKGEEHIVLKNVNGQRYIGDNLGNPNLTIEIFGVAGNDMAFSMNGPTIIVHGNAQDGVGNTMGMGKVVVHGNVGDICGYAMRGGKIFIKGNVGYRSGIHMKEYLDVKPTIVIGGRTGDFLGEYMAGGTLIVLGLHEDGKEIIGSFCGTGMHGGRMFIRAKNKLEQWRLGREVHIKDLDDNDKEFLKETLEEYQKDLNWNVLDKIDFNEFVKLFPGSKRPYGRLYAY
ncbi:MAG: hypothetical protein ACTSU2_15695 [Promethearchaeota archaeon]